MIAAIVAVDENWGIGYNGDLLAHIPEDLKYFKKLTTGNVVIMGRKTWDSLPKKPLPDRINVIITSQKKEIENDNLAFLPMDYVKSLIKDDNDILEDIFIIGGGTIYKELLPYCNKIYITKIQKQFENVDTYFPNLEESKEWKLTDSSDTLTHEDLQYCFQQYSRIN